jgi:hypothetical protein
MVDECLTWVHIAISNLKRFLLGTFHGTTKCYLQNYLNEFCYRFNRRVWEAEIPNRRMRLCVDHRPYDAWDIKLVQSHVSFCLNKTS